LKHAALLEPLAVAYRAARNAKLTLKQDFSSASILILGSGPIGIALIPVLRSFGARTIYVSQSSGKRRSLAQELANIAIDPAEEDVAEICKSLTAGEGVDVVFDCAGVQSAMDDGMKALAFKGTYVNVALWESAVRLPLLPHLSASKANIVQALSSCRGAVEKGTSPYWLHGL
jgi:threonine dehydrogenase-like Zn-dependent dehydrogenase